MPTYRLTCAVCGAPKWPVLARRPEGLWVCALCREGEGKREKGRRGAAARWGRTKVR